LAGDPQAATLVGNLYTKSYATLYEELRPLEHKLVELIEEQRRAGEEQASREQLPFGRRCSLCRQRSMTGSTFTR
jgi:hypothetical protein